MTYEALRFKDLRGMINPDDLLLETSATKIDKLYRRFDQLNHAEDFCTGKIFVSSLQRCRTIEDDARRDEEEGELHEATGLIHPCLPNYRDLMKRAGYDPDVFVNTIISDDLKSYSIRDAWLLCMSSDTSGDRSCRLGEHIVEISSPVELFSEISIQLLEKELATQCLFGKVVYEDARQFKLGENPLAPSPFIKPKRYASEAEFRFVWTHTEQIKMAPSVMQFNNVSKYLRMTRRI